MRSNRFRARMRYMDGVRIVLDWQGYRSPTSIASYINSLHCKNNLGNPWDANDVLDIVRMGFIGRMASEGQLRLLFDFLAPHGWTVAQLAWAIERAHFRRPDGTDWTRYQVREVFQIGKVVFG